MCGIHLIWGKNANEASIQELVDATRHRGPDQEAVYSPWPGLWLGVNRLSITHPGPEADQPFYTQDRSGMLIWNGEIYNFLELRELVESMGEECKTQSDTEVLAYLIKFFSTEALKKIEGMFSFIYIDLLKKTVFVARDPNGEKPLYFYQAQDTLMISSETRGIAQLTKADIELKQLDHYIYFRNPAPGNIFFKGIKTWKLGHYSLLSQFQDIHWSSLSKENPNENPTKTIFQAALEKAVLRQFRADVPVGMMLSGGMDSGLLYAIWYKQTGKALPSFTIQVEKKYRHKYSDGDAATRFTQTYPSDHQLIEVDQKLVLDHWDEYIQSLDQPVGDSASFLTWLIGKQAKGQVKVLISGAGADELWGGYQRHKAFHHYLQFQSFWSLSAVFLKHLPFGREWKKFTSGIGSNPEDTFLNFSALSNPDQKLNADYKKIMDSSYQPYKQALDFDRRVYLVEDVLKINDNSLMANGIEGRSPYLDYQLIKLWENVEDAPLLLGKPWIASCLEDLNLSWISQRKKTGFGLPLLEWLSEDGPFAKKVFATIKDFGKANKSGFPLWVFQLTQNPEKYITTHFLLTYNLFLLAEWLKLQKQ
jgi:asparagine synthase (glutamine-hydrolysing)